MCKYVVTDLQVRVGTLESSSCFSSGFAAKLNVYVSIIAELTTFLDLIC